jgi:DNA processing protein
MTRPPLTITNNFENNSQLSEISDDSLKDSARREIENLLGPDPVAVDELVRQCQMSAPAVRAALLELELAGRLERHPGNRVSLLLTVAPHRS